MSGMFDKYGRYIPESRRFRKRDFDNPFEVSLSEFSKLGRKYVKEKREKVPVVKLKASDTKMFDRDKLAIMLAISNMGGENVLDDMVNQKRDIKRAESIWFQALAEGIEGGEVEANKAFDSEISSRKKTLRSMPDSEIIRVWPDIKRWNSLIKK